MLSAHTHTHTVGWVSPRVWHSWLGLHHERPSHPTTTLWNLPDGTKWRTFVASMFCSSFRWDTFQKVNPSLFWFQTPCAHSRCRDQPFFIHTPTQTHSEVKHLLAPPPAAHGFEGGSGRAGREGLGVRGCFFLLGPCAYELGNRLLKINK